MKRFRFALQPVLELRERRERERMRRLAEAELILQRAQERLASLERRRDEDVQTVRQRHSELALEELQAYYAHLEHMAGEIALQRQRVAAAGSQVAAARAALVTASTEKKVVERLRERRLEAFQNEERLEEQRQVDDTNARVESRVREQRNP